MIRIDVDEVLDKFHNGNFVILNGNSYGHLMKIGDKISICGKKATLNRIVWGKRERIGLDITYEEETKTITE